MRAWRSHTILTAFFVVCSGVADEYHCLESLSAGEPKYIVDPEI